MAADARAFLVRLQRIVREGDKKQFASHVHYPVRVFEGNRRKQITAPKDFVEQYSRILTPDVKQAILTQSPGCLFGNGQGMMIGDGELWFQPESKGGMKVITINVPAPKTDKK